MSETAKGHPKGLYVLFVTEMWERFSYYGMRAIFVLFMTKALLFTKETGSQVYGSYTGLVYLTPLIGGYVADRLWGNRKSIIVGGGLMAIGQFLMFLSGTFYKEVGFASLLMYIGLGFLIFGNGFFKPNISTMVGQLYPQGDHRVDSAFTIFYMGINLGAFFAPLICGFVGDTGNPADFRWGFLAACIGMIFSLVLFISLKDKYIVTPEGEQIGSKPNSTRESADHPKAPMSLTALGIWSGVFVGLFAVLFFVAEFDLIGCFIYSLTIAGPGYIISDPSLTKIERQRIWVIYIIAFFVIFFWSAFEQAGASLTYFAEEQTRREAFGWTIPASYFQSINAVAIVLLAPVFVALWSFLDKRGKEPASPYKQSLGLLLLALGYLVIAFGVKGLEPGVKVSMMWLFSLYTIHTLGELCLSPIGLSMVNKLAPVKFASLLMGVWFLSTSAANKFAGTLSELYPEPLVDVAVVEQLEVERAVKLLPEGYEKSIATCQAELAGKSDKDKEAVKGCGRVARTLAGKPVVAMERIQLAEVKDEAQKEELRQKIESSTVPNPKSFLGLPIASLYDFFMLFVGMAGLSAVFLFFLSKKLLSWMHGVR